MIPLQTKPSLDEPRSLTTEVLTMPFYMINGRLFEVRDGAYHPIEDSQAEGIPRQMRAEIFPEVSTPNPPPPAAFQPQSPIVEHERPPMMNGPNAAPTGMFGQLRRAMKTAPKLPADRLNKASLDTHTDAVAYSAASDDFWPNSGNGIAIAPLPGMLSPSMSLPRAMEGLYPRVADGKSLGGPKGPALFRDWPTRSKERIPFTRANGNGPDAEAAVDSLPPITPPAQRTAEVAPRFANMETVPEESFFVPADTDGLPVQISQPFGRATEAGSFP